LVIYEKDLGSNWHQIGSVGANSSSKLKGFVFEVKYQFEARNGLTVVVTFEHHDTNVDHQEVTSTIN